MRASWLTKEVYHYVDRFYMQQARDAERIIRLGANPDHVFVSGNLKFDFPSIESADSLKELFGRAKIQSSSLFWLHLHGLEKRLYWRE